MHPRHLWSTTALSHWYSNHFSPDCSPLGCTCSIVLFPLSYLGGRWVRRLRQRRGLWFVLICGRSLGRESGEEPSGGTSPHLILKTTTVISSRCTETGTIQSIRRSLKACPISSRPDRNELLHRFWQWMAPSLVWHYQRRACGARHTWKHKPSASWLHGRLISLLTATVLSLIKRFVLIKSVTYTK